MPPAANMPLPPYPRRCPSDKGSTKQVQAENANALRKSSDSETDRLQDIQEEPRRRIGPSRVKELAKFFMPTSDEEENSRVNNRTRCKKLFEPKKEEEIVIVYLVIVNCNSFFACRQSLFFHGERGMSGYHADTPITIKAEAIP